MTENTATPNSRMGPREWLVVGVFALHGVAGVAYLIRLFVVGEFRSLGKRR